MSLLVKSLHACKAFDYAIKWNKTERNRIEQNKTKYKNKKIQNRKIISRINIVDLNMACVTNIYAHKSEHKQRKN